MAANTVLLTVQNKHTGQIFVPLLEGEIQVEQERIGSCSKLTCKMIKAPPLDFQEGDAVSLVADGYPMFLGYVFEKQRTSEQIIAVTAYDQLRYLKYRSTKRFENKTATEVLRAAAKDQNLMLGTVHDTKFKVPTLVYKDKTFLDMFLEHLAESQVSDVSLYALYDDYGKICLQPVEKMKTDYAVYPDVMRDYDYTSSIDGDTYNRVAIFIDDEKKPGAPPIEAMDSGKIQEWGSLLYTETVDSTQQAKAIALARLQTFCRKSRVLDIKKSIGNPRIRGGALIFVSIPNLGDLSVQDVMMVERVTHTFSENEHWMDLTLINKDFQTPAKGAGGASAKEEKKGSSKGKQSPGAKSSKAAKTLQAAVSQQGKPYVWGADGPNSFDCSGLVSYAMRQAGALPKGERLTASGFAKDTKYTYGIRKAELKPGDICVGYGNPNHIAIYAGNGKVFEAKSKNQGIRYGPLEGRKFTVFKRIKGS